MLYTFSFQRVYSEVIYPTVPIRVLSVVDDWQYPNEMRMQMELAKGNVQLRRTGIQTRENN